MRSGILTEGRPARPSVVESLGAPTRVDVVAASQRLEHRIRRTPLLDATTGDGARLVLKLECFQVSGSFKIRGATNRILLDERRHAGVVAASGGNHGAAVAHACRDLGLKADVFVPASSPHHKLRRITDAGAELHVVDGPFTEAAARCTEFAAEYGALLVHPFDDPAVIAGQGTLGVEILDQCAGVTKIVVAVGGGGLAAGLAVAVDGKTELLAVEPEACPTLSAALEAGRPVLVEVGGVAADSLGAPLLGDLAFDILAPTVSSVIAVSEKDIVAAQQSLWDAFRLAVEPAAGCCWAAAQCAAASMSPEDIIVVVVCGANLDPQTVVEW